MNYNTCCELFQIHFSLMNLSRFNIQFKMVLSIVTQMERVFLIEFIIKWQTITRYSGYHLFRFYWNRVFSVGDTNTPKQNDVEIKIRRQNDWMLCQKTESGIKSETMEKRFSYLPVHVVRANRRVNHFVNMLLLRMLFHGNALTAQLNVPNGAYRQITTLAGVCLSPNFSIKQTILAETTKNHRIFQR